MQRVFLFLLMVILLVACSPFDISEVGHTVSTDAIKQGEYLDVAWIDTNHIAYLYRSDTGTYSWENEIVVYDLESKESHIIDVPQRETCSKGSTEEIERKSSGKLVALFDCPTEENALRAEFTLWEWDGALDKWQQLKKYPIGLFARTIGFAPNGNSWIQTDDASGIMGRLTYEYGDETSQPLLPTFARAKDATFNPNSDQIAFLASGELPDVEVNIFAGAPAIEAQINQPWDLYSTIDNFQSYEKIVTGIRKASELKWSPDAQFLTWHGIYAGQTGIFRLDVDTKKVEIVRRGEAEYDWSPDGTALVVIPEDEAGQLLILDFSNEPNTP